MSPSNSFAVAARAANSEQCRRAAEQIHRSFLAKVVRWAARDDAATVLGPVLMGGVAAAAVAAVPVEVGTGEEGLCGSLTGLGAPTPDTDVSVCGLNEVAEALALIRARVFAESRPVAEVAQEILVGRF